MGAALLGDEHDRHHQHERHQDDRQIDFPELAGIQAAHLGQQGGHHDKQRHLDQVQHEHAEIQAQQVAVGQDFARTGGLHGASLRARHHRHHKARHAQADDAQTGDGPEQAGQPPPAHQHGRQDERHRERQADRPAHHGHGARADLVAGGVGQPGGDGGGNGARPLDGAPDAAGRTARRGDGPNGRRPARRGSA
ncbi:hypothetical protein G6F68_014117 [Rhizopus microsporus]|nr:hypothetical protein G6F68_014117 [Rhizopus microsporus]